MERVNTKMKPRLYMILTLVCFILIYLSVFISNFIYTKPTKDEALYKVTNGFSIYYTNDTGEWTPFVRYNTVFKTGYYSTNLLGTWIFHNSELKLSGVVRIENDINR